MTRLQKTHAETEARHNRWLGQRLALFRSARGLRLVEVAQELGVGLQLVQRYESGEMPVPFGRLLRLCEVLGVSLPALLGEAFEAGGGEEAESAAVLQIARIAGRLPPPKRAVLIAMARELGRP
jgi:transcriptional regulator with XRE-family HTH domain